MPEGKILIIDDEAVVRDVLAAILQDAGFQVAQASTAFEGVERATRWGCDLAMVDIMLPDGDGMEVLKALSQMDEDLKTLVITGYPALETAMEAVRLGAFDYLTKPLETERVLISVQNALSARRLALRNKESLHSLRRTNTVLEAINKVSRQALACETQQDLASMCLKLALEVTDSQAGFIGELTQAGRVRILAVSDNGPAVWGIPDSAELAKTQGIEVHHLYGRVLEEETSLLINDLDCGPANIGSTESQPPLVSFLGAPLKHQDRTFGIIALANNPAGYDATHQEAINSLSIFLGEGLSRKRAEELARRQAARAHALARVAARLNAQLDLDEVLNTVCKEAAQALAAPAASVNLYDERRGLLRYGVANHNLPPEFRELMRPTLYAIPDHFERETGPILVIPDAQAVPELPNASVYSALNVRTIVSAGMVHKGEVIGSLDVFTYGQPIPFAEHELETMRGLANLAAQAIANARLFEQVRAGRERLRDLTGYLESAREEERTRIAREIHDLLSQRLNALKWDLAWVHKRLPPDDARLTGKLDAMSRSIESTIHDMRRIGLELRPQLLDHLGLAAAIEWQAQEFAERTGIDCSLSLPQEELALDRDLATAVFRIFQETLTNVARHADATSVRVELANDPDELLLTVRDNGKGITETQIADPRSLGLIGMRERARAKSGEISFEGSSGRGTTVRVCIRHKNRAEGKT